MNEQDYYDPPRRKRNLSEDDLDALRAVLQSHCRLGSLTSEDVESFHRISRFLDKDENLAALKRIAKFIQDVENRVVGFLTWGIVAIVCVIVALAYNHGYLVKK